jgi:OmpA-OmpF porin, OOP family
MRKFGLSLVVCGLAATPYAALSQQGSTSTPDEYVCALTGDCGQDAPGARTGAPGSDLQATRSFTMSQPGSGPEPAAATPQRRPATARRPIFRPRVATSERGRVNLRLAFGSGSSTLSSSAQAEVQAFAEAMQRPQLSSMRFRIEGHTDSAGGRAVNLSLSQRRAQAVADYLMARGIARSRLEVQGYGFDRPLPRTPVSSGRNRRVEAVRIS